MTTMRATTPARLPASRLCARVRYRSPGLTILGNYGEKDQGRTDGSSHPQGRGEDRAGDAATAERPLHAAGTPRVQGKRPLGPGPPPRLPGPRPVDHSVQRSEE